MANLKSSKKRVKVNRTKNLQNNIVRTSVRTAIKKFERALLDGNIEEAEKNLINAVSKLDKAATRGVIHKNTAARKKSSLYRKFNNYESAS
ncbi:MAG TPA: 30S ribosomal protein S20 [Thermoanaerobacterales bacterium]|nr:30S ribosomal protein S20 [Thermoanaerobacterales bacterium]